MADNNDRLLDSSSVDIGDGRPRIKHRSGQTSKFSVNDKVYLDQGRGLRGPYLVSSVPSDKKYKLCEMNGTIQVDNGAVFAEAQLSFA